MAHLIAAERRLTEAEDCLAQHLRRGEGISGHNHRELLAAVTEARRGIDAARTEWKTKRNGRR